MSDAASSCSSVRVTLIALGVLLLATGPVSAASERILGTDRDSLSAAAVAFRLQYGAALFPSASPSPLSRDRWLARDKVKHVTVSALWTLSTQYVLVNKADWTETDALPASIASGAAIGVAKEVYDASHRSETASGKDLVADAVGIGLAVGIVWL